MPRNVGLINAYNAQTVQYIEYLYKEHKKETEVALQTGDLTRSAMPSSSRNQMSAIISPPGIAPVKFGCKLVILFVYILQKNCK